MYPTNGNAARETIEDWRQSSSAFAGWGTT